MHTFSLSTHMHGLSTALALQTHEALLARNEEGGGGGEKGCEEDRTVLFIWRNMRRLPTSLSLALLYISPYMHNSNLHRYEETHVCPLFLRWPSIRKPTSNQQPLPFIFFFYSFSERELYACVCSRTFSTPTNIWAIHPRPRFLCYSRL